MRSRSLAGLLLILALAGITLADPDTNTPQILEARSALQKLNGLIGGWRGTGQPRRGSNKGAWREDAEFVWDFSTRTPAIKYVVKDGKLTAQATLTYVDADKQYQFVLKSAEGTETTLTGGFQNDQLVLTSAEEGPQQRVTITPLNEKRTVVLFETRSNPAASFNRVAEVGYTREGTRLALPGGGQPECVVTGGAASIPVSYKGQTYYVCCTGCKQAFEDDPEGILAEYRERIKKAKEEAGS